MTPDQCSMEQKSENKPVESKVGFLYLTTFIVNIPMFVSGTAFSWTSPVIPKLLEIEDANDNPLGNKITAVEESCITCLLSLGISIGPFLGILTVDKFGRIKSLQWFCFPIFISYIILGLAKTIYLYYFARFFMGLGIGGVMLILPMYFGEICEDKNRGPISCWMTISLILGTELPYAIGPYLNIEIFSYICAAPLIIFHLFCFFVIPDSPIFFVMTGNVKKGEASLQKLRGLNSDQVQSELISLTRMNTEQVGFKTLFSNRGFRRALIIGSGQFSFQQLSGIITLSAFMESIFLIAKSGMSIYASVNLIGCLQVLTGIVVTLVVDRFGRRMLLLISSILCCISISVIATYIYLQDVEGKNLEQYGWLLIGSFIVYIISFNFGIGIIPLTMASELLHISAKLVSNVLITFIGFLVQFLLVLIYPIMTDYISAAWSFWLYGGFCFFSFIFTYYMVPETKGKSLNEIQDILNDGKLIMS